MTSDPGDLTSSPPKPGRKVPISHDHDLVVDDTLPLKKAKAKYLEFQSGGWTCFGAVL